MANENLNQELTKQLKALMAEFISLCNTAGYDDFSNLPDTEAMRFITRAQAAVHRIAGDASVYASQCREVLSSNAYLGQTVSRMGGVLQSLLSDMEDGYLDSVSELIHGEMFADFLEMAQHLMDEGYKDAAAVIAGSVLEGHLRQLCQQAGVETDTEVNGVPKPKKAERMNADLAKASVYTKTDQKNVTAWLDLRNKAAHGQYEEYEAGQVRLLISNVRDFFHRNPA